MKPKDLLEHLEKGDRTMEMLKPEPATDMRNLAEQIGSLSNLMAQQAGGLQSGAGLGQYYQSPQQFGNVQFVQGGQIQPRQGYIVEANPYQARYW